MLQQGERSVLFIPSCPTEKASSDYGATKIHTLYR